MTTNRQQPCIPHPPPADLRLDCEEAEDLCDALEVGRTPTLAVFHAGAEVEKYKADFLHIDLFKPFILRMRDRLLLQQQKPYDS